MSKRLSWSLFSVALLGLLASFELAISYIRVLQDPTYVPGCNISPVLSCGPNMDSVAGSVLGFPNPLLGIAGFGALACFYFLAALGSKLPLLAWKLVTVSLVASGAFLLWLVYQSLYVINSLCPWCTLVWAVIAVCAVLTSAALANSPEDRGVLARTYYSLRWVVLAGIFALVLGLIFVRWSDYWLSLL